MSNTLCMLSSSFELSSRALHEFGSNLLYKKGKCETKCVIHMDIPLYLFLDLLWFRHGHLGSGPRLRQCRLQTVHVLDLAVSVHPGCAHCTDVWGPCWGQRG